jgi:hypothetical protein
LKTTTGGNGAAGRKVKDSASVGNNREAETDRASRTAAASPYRTATEATETKTATEAKNIMVEILNLSQFNRAKLRASAGKLVVTESTVDRQWRVMNEENGNVYRVTFMQGADGRKFATCECAGGQGGYTCKHMAVTLPMAVELQLAVEARERIRAAIPALPRWTPNPAFDEPDADIADCDVANWQ